MIAVIKDQYWGDERTTVPIAIFESDLLGDAYVKLMEDAEAKRPTPNYMYTLYYITDELPFNPTSVEETK